MLLLHWWAPLHFRSSFWNVAEDELDTIGSYYDLQVANLHFLLLFMLHQSASLHPDRKIECPNIPWGRELWPAVNETRRPPQIQSFLGTLLGAYQATWKHPRRFLCHYEFVTGALQSISYRNAMFKPIMADEPGFRVEEIMCDIVHPNALGHRCVSSHVLFL